MVTVYDLSTGRQPIPRTEISTLPRAVGNASTRTSGFRRQQGLFRALRRTHRRFVVEMPSLSPRPHAADRDLAAKPTQASNADQGYLMMEEDCFEIWIQLCRTSLAEPSDGSSIAKRVTPKKIGGTDLASPTSS